MLNAKLFILLGLSVVVNCYKDVCYGDLGCFTDRPPFSTNTARPFAYVPQPPEMVGTNFLLYKRNSDGDIITADSIPSSFNPSLPTKFIVHGFIQDGNKAWIGTMKEALLRVQDFNIIVVDWSKGNGFPYTQAVANAQLVGAEIAHLIRSLISRKSIGTSKIHIIGHSLGAHIAGYAGERLETKLGRITGLDPAGPYFEFTDPRVRLDPTDAEFVDVIHTDGASTLKLGFGLLEKAGHVDFYPNGGLNQPNCAQLPDKVITGLYNLATNNADNLENVTGCSHVAAYKYFIDSIENTGCKYNGYPCSSQSEFDLGSCLGCSSEKGCNRMGYWASPNNDLGSLYLNTQDANDVPFCKHNYQVKLYSNSLKSQTQTRGKVSMYLRHSHYSTDVLVLDDSSFTYKPNAVSTFLLSLDNGLDGRIDSVVLTFRKTSNLLSSWLYDNEWSFKYIEILDGDEQILTRLCPPVNQQVIASGKSVEYHPCESNSEPSSIEE